MLSTNVNRVNSVLIGSGTNSAAASALTLETLAKGDLVLALADGTILGTNAAAAAIGKNKDVYIVMGLGQGRTKMSSPINARTVTAFNFKKFQAPTLQTTYVGYTGAAFSGISVVDEQEYQLNVLIKDSYRPHGQKQTVERYNYKTKVSATTSDLVFGLLRLFGNKSSNGSQKVYKNRFVDMFVLNSSTTQTALAANATMRYGSRYVKFSAAHGRAVGDILRIGGTTNATAVYKVSEVIDANTLYLESPYAGASATVLAANILVVTPHATQYALKFVSQTPTPVVRNEWEIVAFEVFLNKADNASTFADFTSTTTAKPSYGSGYWKGVKDREYYAMGYEGWRERTEEYHWTTELAPTFFTVEGAEYHSITIEGFRTESGDLQDTRTNPVADEIYIPVVSTPPADGEQANEAAEDFVHILNGYFNGVLGFTAVDFS